MNHLQKRLRRLFYIEMESVILSIMLISFFSFSSCKKEYNCDKTNLILSFTNKTIDSLNNFTIYKFQKGTTFGVLLDSLRIINGAGVNFEIVNNNTRVWMQSVDFRIVGDFDWKVHLFSTTVDNGLHEISVSSIEEQNETMKCKKKDFATMSDGCQCMNTLISYKLNNIQGSIGNKIESNSFMGYEIVINP